MKNTNNMSFVVTAAITAVGMVALTKLAASFVPVAVIASSYFAVAILFALAAVDYRVGTRNYSAR